MAAQDIINDTIGRIQAVYRDFVPEIMGNTQKTQPMVNSVNNNVPVFNQPTTNQQPKRRQPVDTSQEQNRLIQLLQLAKKIAQSKMRGQVLAAQSDYPADVVSSYKATPIKFTGTWQDLINKATRVAQQYDIPPAVMVSQMAVESGRGTSSFARNRNNLFGYMAYDSNPDAARTYATPEDSMQDYAKLLTTDPRYSGALQYRNDPYKFISEVKRAGYATDPNYVQKVTSTPEYRQYAGG